MVCFRGNELLETNPRSLKAQRKQEQKVEENHMSRREAVRRGALGIDV